MNRGALRIWFDALTPKELLFFEYMMGRAGPEHQMLFTSRDYHEVNELARMRGLNPTYVGRHGGGMLDSKLDAAISRMGELVGIVKGFSPDVTVSALSPDAARISFGLGIPHIGLCNSEHHDATNRLCMPLLTRLLIPSYLPKRAFTVYGIGEHDIVQYAALDEIAIIRNRTIPWDAESAGLQSGRKTIVFRTYESQASYVQHQTDMEGILDRVTRDFPDCNIVVMGRYPDQKRALRDRYGKNAIVLDGAVDGGAVLSECDVFVGSGGTMTTEAVLRGIPTISYDAVPTSGGRRLVREGLMSRAKTPAGIVRVVQRLLASDPGPFRARAREMMSGMEDPYDVLKVELDALDT